MKVLATLGALVRKPIKAIENGAETLIEAGLERSRRQPAVDAADKEKRENGKSS
jgi:hypothetical protein